MTVRKLKSTGLCFFISLLFISSCKKDEEMPDTPELLQAQEGEELSGGIYNTVFDHSVNAFGFESPGLSGGDQLLFFVGNSFFNQSWVSAPASTTARDGLGPTFNAFACSSCHFKDGRGRPPKFFGEKASGLLLRISVPGVDQNGAPLPHSNYGDQLQDQSILGVKEEGTIQLNYSEIQGQYADGEKFSLQKPSYQITNLNYGSLPGNIQISPRVAQQMIGMGLLDAIEKSDLLLLADELDTDNDGISGKVNWVWDVEKQSNSIGRFGWKANQPSIAQQVAAAFNGDMGITTSLFPSENCPTPQIDCGNAANGGSPEITNPNFKNVVLYASNLAVPARRKVNNQAILEGKQIFNELACTSCHHPTFKTGTNSPFKQHQNQKIWPYSDLLLHDMGEGLADNRPDFLATGKEWRTQPLWGIGLIKTVNGHSNLLHDGRARNVEEAILWHGGEAEVSKNKFVNLEAIQREKLIQFIYSL